MQSGVLTGSLTGWVDTAQFYGMPVRHQRILHVDGDAFFASCEITLALVYEEAWLPLEPGGGKSGDGQLPLLRTWGRSTNRATKFG